MFAPVGVGGEHIKIAPLLTFEEEALHEEIAVLEQACSEILRCKARQFRRAASGRF